MKRFAPHHRVYYVEEPIRHAGPDGLSLYMADDNLFVITPKLNDEVFQSNVEFRIEKLVKELIDIERIKNPLLWYYTPMALLHSSFLESSMIIYDCMDELTGFMNAPAELPALEGELFRQAHIVFTGGKTLYEHKKSKHPNVYLFPSSIDKEHFEQARRNLPDPADQESIPIMRFGFFGVVDERFDKELIREAAAQNPHWQFVIIGPIVKIDPQSLPSADNIHYLGSKLYNELPQYIANWDVALIPFALNESTKYISPTKTPEYLAAGKPVISTGITDVQHPYGELGLVQIVSTVDEFTHAGVFALSALNKTQWLAEVDDFLKDISWDNTWESMNTIIQDHLAHKRVSLNSQKAYV